MNSKKTERFIEKLAHQLKDDCVPLPKPKKLKKIFSRTVLAAKDDKLKHTLSKHFDECLAVFLRTLHQEAKPDKESGDLFNHKQSNKVTNGAIEGPDTPYNLYSKKGSVVSDDYTLSCNDCEKKHINQTYLRCCLPGTEDCDTLIDIANKCQDPTSDKLPWLQRVQSVCMSFCGENDVIKLQHAMVMFNREYAEAAEKGMKKGKHLKMLQKTGRQYLQYFHVKRKSVNAPFKKHPAYRDLLAGILATYIDVCLELNRSGTLKQPRSAHELCSFVLLLLDDSIQYGCDVLLQLERIQAEDHILLLNLVNCILQTTWQNMNHTSYTKYVLTVRSITQLWPSEAQHLKQKALQVPAPDDYLNWIKNRDPSLMDEFPETKHFRATKITHFLLDELTDDTVHGLLDLLTEAAGTDETAGDGDQYDVDTTDKDDAPLFVIDTAPDSKTAQFLKDNAELEEKTDQLEEEDTNIVLSDDDDLQIVSSDDDQDDENQKETIIYEVLTKAEAKRMNIIEQTEKALDMITEEAMEVVGSTQKNTDDNSESESEASSDNCEGSDSSSEAGDTDQEEKGKSSDSAMSDEDEDAEEMMEHLDEDREDEANSDSEDNRSDASSNSKSLENDVNLPNKKIDHICNEALDGHTITQQSADYVQLMKSKGKQFSKKQCGCGLDSSTAETSTGTLTSDSEVVEDKGIQRNVVKSMSANSRQVSHKYKEKTINKPQITNAANNWNEIVMASCKSESDVDVSARPINLTLDQVLKICSPKGIDSDAASIRRSPRKVKTDSLDKNEKDSGSPSKPSKHHTDTKSGIKSPSPHKKESKVPQTLFISPTEGSNMISVLDTPPEDTSDIDTYKKTGHSLRMLRSPTKSEHAEGDSISVLSPSAFDQPSQKTKNSPKYILSPESVSSVTACPSVKTQRSPKPTPSRSPAKDDHSQAVRRSPPDRKPRTKYCIGCPDNENTGSVSPNTSKTTIDMDDCNIVSPAKSEDSPQITYKGKISVPKSGALKLKVCSPRPVPVGMLPRAEGGEVVETQETAHSNMEDAINNISSPKNVAASVVSPHKDHQKHSTKTLPNTNEDLINSPRRSRRMSGRGKIDQEKQISPLKGDSDSSVLLLSDEKSTSPLSAITNEPEQDDLPLYDLPESDSSIDLRSRRRIKVDMHRASPTSTEKNMKQKQSSSKSNVYDITSDSDFEKTPVRRRSSQKFTAMDITEKPRDKRMLEILEDEGISARKKRTGSMKDVADSGAEDFTPSKQMKSNSSKDAEVKVSKTNSTRRRSMPAKISRDDLDSESKITNTLTELPGSPRRSRRLSEMSDTNGDNENVKLFEIGKNESSTTKRSKVDAEFSPKRHKTDTKARRYSLPAPVENDRAAKVSQSPEKSSVSRSTQRHSLRTRRSLAGDL